MNTEPEEELAQPAEPKLQPTPGADTKPKTPPTGHTIPVLHRLPAFGSKRRKAPIALRPAGT